MEPLPLDEVVSIDMILEQYEDYPPFLSLSVLERDHGLIEIDASLIVGKLKIG